MAADHLSLAPDVVRRQEAVSNHIKRRLHQPILVAPYFRGKRAGQCHAVGVAEGKQGALHIVVERDHVHKQRLAIPGGCSNLARHKPFAVLSSPDLGFAVESATYQSINHRSSPVCLPCRQRTLSHAGSENIWISAERADRLGLDRGDDDVEVVVGSTLQPSNVSFTEGGDKM
jgi:hypothetical protein